MSKYELTFPRAEAMVKAERAERLPPRKAYAERAVAVTVRNAIWRDYWLNDCGHKHAVDLVESLIRTLGNAGPWQDALLRELQLRRGEQHDLGLCGPYIVDGPPRRAYYEEPYKEFALRVYRRDHAAMSEFG